MLAVSKNTKSTLAKSIELANPNFSQKRIASMENSEQLSRFLASFLEDGFGTNHFAVYPRICTKSSWDDAVAGLSFQSSTASLWKVARGHWEPASASPPPQNKPPRDMWVSLSESFESVRVVFSISQVPVNHS